MLGQDYFVNKTSVSQVRQCSLKFPPPPAMMWIYKISNQYKVDLNLFMLKPLLNSHGNVDVRFYPFACRGKKKTVKPRDCENIVICLKMTQKVIEQININKCG